MKKGTERKIHVLKLITDIFKEGLVYLSRKYRQISHTYQPLIHAALYNVPRMLLPFC